MITGLKEVSCHIPFLNPFDSSILKFVNISKPLDCASEENAYQTESKLRKFSSVFETDEHSNLILLKDLNANGIETCCYKKYSRIDDLTLK